MDLSAGWSSRLSMRCAGQGVHGVCAVAGLASAGALRTLPVREILASAEGKGARLPGNLRAGAVGGNAARTADRHLHKRGERCNDGGDENADEPERGCWLCVP